MNYIETKIEGFKLRETSEKDIPLILNLIKEIAIYEKMLDQVIATEETLKESIFNKDEAEVLIAEFNGEPIGYVLYFYNFSTFIGRSGFYLEDIYIKPEYRGKGIGKEIFRLIAGIAFEKGCRRMEWTCLNWNEPSINFYKSLGAVPMSEWTVYRLDRENIEKVSKMK
ncbi:GNAT family N-acetyltransferase [Clostridium chrysemydis]|uniref:GNAT family N-acetyltransferase n=1 Tax=Clostridium chrysemydis TaxID=2665504 RepID=UPI001883E861|nr:GNAT family N-acetyltransferase [Clostridium chrysemydis]